MKQLLSYTVTLLPFRVYIALEKLVFRRTNKKTMHIPRKTYFLVEELEKKAVVEPAPAVWHNLQFGARPPAVSKYQRIKKCLPLYFCISLIMYFSFCALSCTTCILALRPRAVRKYQRIKNLFHWEKFGKEPGQKQNIAMEGILQ